MPTPSPKLGLALPSQPDDFSTADLRANWEKIDAAPGTFICTSTTRPAWGPNQSGRKIFETNTAVTRIWTGAEWLVDGLQPGDMVWTSRAEPSGRELLCDGRLLNRSTYSHLFAAVGTTFNTGGEPADSFRLPAPGGMAVAARASWSGATTFERVGKVQGSPTVSLTEANLPQHAHSMDHNHAPFTSGGNNRDHYHAGQTGEAHASGDVVIVGDAGGGLAGNHFVGFESGSPSYPQWNDLPVPGGNHAHYFTTGGVSSGHEHEIDVPWYTGSTGRGNGTSAPISVIQPTMTFNLFIRY